MDKNKNKNKVHWCLNYFQSIRLLQADPSPLLQVWSIEYLYPSISGLNKLYLILIEMRKLAWRRGNSSHLSAATATINMSTTVVSEKILHSTDLIFFASFSVHLDNFWTYRERKAKTDLSLTLFFLWMVTF